MEKLKKMLIEAFSHKTSSKLKNDWLNFHISLDAKFMEKLIDLFLEVSEENQVFISFDCMVNEKPYKVSKFLLESKHLKNNELIKYTNNLKVDKTFNFTGISFGIFQGYIELNNLQIEII